MALYSNSLGQLTTVSLTPCVLCCSCMWEIYQMLQKVFLIGLLAFIDR